MDSDSSSGSREKLKRREMFSKTKDGTKTKHVKADFVSHSVYDLIGEIEKLTHLKRST